MSTDDRRVQGALIAVIARTRDNVVKRNIGHTPRAFIGLDIFAREPEDVADPKRFLCVVYFIVPKGGGGVDERNPHVRACRTIIYVSIFTAGEFAYFVYGHIEKAKRPKFQNDFYGYFLFLTNATSSYRGRYLHINVLLRFVQ